MECENHKATSSSVTGYREMIDKYAKEGYSYIGYIPTKWD